MNVYGYVQVVGSLSSTSVNVYSGGNLSGRL